MSTGSGPRLGARLVLAAVSVLLVAVPSSLLLVAVLDGWGPLHRPRPALWLVVTIEAGGLLAVPLLGRRRRVAAVVVGLVVVLAVGYSRLGLGLHYVSDVLGGYVLGLAWLAASTAAFRPWLRGGTR